MIRVLVSIFFLVYVAKAHPQEIAADTLLQTATVEAQDALYYQQQAKRTSSPNQKLEYLQKALSLRTVRQDESWLADIRVEMGQALLKSNRIKEAFTELLTAEKIYAEAGDVSSRADVLVVMARFYKKNSSWKEAGQFYSAALKLQDSAKNFGDAARVALHLSDIALHTNNINQAKKHISYAVKHYSVLNDKTGLALAFVNRAEIYRRQQQYKSAERLIIDKALPYFRSTGYETGRIGCFDVLGKVYLSQRRFSEAKWFFIQANTQSRELNDREGIISSLTNLARVKINIGDYSLARRDLAEAQKLASNHQDLFLLANVKAVYAELYAGTGQSGRAEDASYSAQLLRDSMDTYLAARVESARNAKARIKQAPVQKSRTAVSRKEDTGLIIKIVAGALAVLLIIFLILRKIK